MRTIQRGREALSSDFFDEPLILEDGEIVIPSPRSILEHEERYHVNSMEQQKHLLVEINEACLALDNAARKHKQSYDY